MEDNGRQGSGTNGKILEDNGRPGSGTNGKVMEDNGRPGSGTNGKILEENGMERFWKTMGDKVPEALGSWELAVDARYQYPASRD